MNKNNTKSIMSMVVFWGSMWGIAEATLGYFFHLLSFVVPGLAGFVMFPVGVYFMRKAYRDTGEVWHIFSVASVAAGIKLVDLLLPFLHPTGTINAAIAILLEAGAVFAFFTVLKKYKVSKFRFGGAFVMSIGWRLGFIAYNSIIAPSAGILQHGAPFLLRFLLLESAVNGLLIATYLKYEPTYKEKGYTKFVKAHPSVSAVLLVLTLFVHIGFSVV